MEIGKTCWAIADGYIPRRGPSSGMFPESHETVCILNAGDRPANIKITVFFSEREPVGPYELQIPPRRTRYVRFDELRRPRPIPRERDYASVIVSDVPVIVQHTRVDARPAKQGVLSPVPYAT